MKIGILGGSFDPIHNGHLNMAKAALEEYALDQVWLMPAAHSPNKAESGMTDGIHRLNMCRIAAECDSRIVASDFEYQFEDTSYTYRTLERLSEQYPDCELYFIMGADSLDYFDKWYYPEIIASLCTIIVIIREGFSIDDINSKIKEIEEQFDCCIKPASCERYDISSTELRDKISKQQDCKEYIPIGVYNYIINNKIYTVM